MEPKLVAGVAKNCTPALTALLVSKESPAGKQRSNRITDFARCDAAFLCLVVRTMNTDRG